MGGENPGEKSIRKMMSSAGFVYNSDVSPTNSQIQSFEGNAEMFNLEMIGFPQKNLQQPVIWKGFFGKHGNQSESGPSSSKTTTAANFYQHEFNKSDFGTGISQTSSENLMVAPPESAAVWQENRLMVDDPSSFRCVFPCEGNERPSQGLSLSLSSTNPSSIGLQSFELRHTHQHHHHQVQQDDEDEDHIMIRFLSANSRDGFFGKSAAAAIQEQQMMQDDDGFVGKASNQNQGNFQFQLRNSKYLAPAQQLLNEFCNLGTQQIDPANYKQKAAKTNHLWEDDQNRSSNANSSTKPTLYSLELVELQKRKSKLLSMLEEV